MFDLLGAKVGEGLFVFDGHDFVEMFQGVVPVFQDDVGDGGAGVLAVLLDEFTQ
jgi:hypothetical protein